MLKDERRLLELIAENQMAIMMGLIVTIAPCMRPPENNREALDALWERVGLIGAELALFRGRKDA